MKLTDIFFAFAASLSSLIASASAETFSYPEGAPVVSINFPDSWTVEPEREILHSGPPDGSLYFGFLPMPRGVSADTAGDIVGGMVNQMVTDFVPGNDSEFTINGITFWSSDAKGKDKESGEELNVTMTFFMPDLARGQMFATVYFGTHGSQSKYQKALMDIVGSIKNQS